MKILNIKTTITLFIFSLFCLTLSADTYSSKSFLTTRPISSYLPIEQSLWLCQIDKLKELPSNTFMGTIQAVGFYQESTHKTSLGKYFGINKNNEITIAPYASTSGTYPDINSHELIHNYLFATTPSTLRGTLKLSPRIESYGVNFYYHQKFKKILSKLFLQVNLPIVHKKHNLNATVSNETNESIDSLDSGVLDYFRGNVSQSSGANKQSALTKAKIGNSTKTTGIADIKPALGYAFIDNNNQLVSLAAQVTIPTGNKNSGDNLFQAIRGNNRHWEIGAQLETKNRILEKENKYLDLFSTFQINYMFRNSQTRTVGLLDNDFHPQDFGGRYLPAGKASIAGTFPLANVLTREVYVRPGFNSQANIILSYTYKKLICNFGYNLFTKASESVSIKSWSEDTYGAASYDYNATQAFDGTDSNKCLHAMYITQSMLNCSEAVSPAALTHAIHCSFGFLFDNSFKPLLIGIGGSYEFARENSAASQYTLWLKAGLSF